MLSSVSWSENRQAGQSEDAAPRGTTAESVSYDRTSVDRIGLTTYT